MATFAPSSVSDSATARPIPEDEPQTIATRPFRPRSTLSGRKHADDVPQVPERQRLRQGELSISRFAQPTLQL